MPDTNESTGQTIGFVGLGLMGQALTARLVETGHDVVGYDINPDALAKATAHGVRPAGSLAELAGLANIIQLCVISTAAVVDIVEGAGGLMASPDAHGRRGPLYNGRGGDTPTGTTVDGRASD